MAQQFMTCGIQSQIYEDAAFAEQVFDALLRFERGDWGDVCAEDARLNDEDVAAGYGALGSYETKLGKIWIDSRPGYTTVLFPDEY